MAPEYNHSRSDTESRVAVRGFAAVASDFAAGRLTPSEELQTMLARIERYEPEIRAFASLAPAEARQAATHADARWARRAALSPIDGMVLGIKDIFETVDMP